MCSELSGRDGPVEAPLVHSHAPNPPNWSHATNPAAHAHPNPQFEMPGAWPSYPSRPPNPALPVVARTVPPPNHWGGTATAPPATSAVLLRQADGHTEVRVFAQPAAGAVVSVIPSGSHGEALAWQGQFVQVRWGRVCGWVGAKNVVMGASTVGSQSAAASPASSHSSPSRLNVSHPSPGQPGPDGLSFASPQAGCLPRRSDGFDWIRKANAEEDRQLRRAGAEQTLAAVQAGGYALDGRRVALSAVGAVRLVVQPGPLRQGSCSTTFFRHPPGALMDVASSRAAAGVSVAAVNAASAYHSGGGFLTGGRHALEESVVVETLVLGCNAL